MAVQTIKLSATSRGELGSRANQRLRKTGNVPAVVYGHKAAVLPISVDKRQMMSHLNKGAHLFDLDLGGQSETVLIKEAQYDHLGIELLHVDFARVSLDEKVEVTVPLELKGTPKGEADGGVLQQIIAELEIECRVLDIPEVIRHNVSDMAKDDVLHIKDLKLPDGVRCLQDEDLLVATVKEIQEEQVAPTEGETAEPEVIGRVADEDSAEATDAKAEKK